MFWVIIEDVYFGSIHTKYSCVMVYVKRNSNSHAKTNRFTYKGPCHNSRTTKETIVKFHLFLMECSNHVVELFVKSNSNFIYFFLFSIFQVIILERNKAVYSQSNHARNVQSIGEICKIYVKRIVSIYIQGQGTHKMASILNKLRYIYKKCIR